MGRYVLYHGAVRPSDSYLAAHPDFQYDSDDWYDDDYDVEDDDEVLYMQWTCEDCGTAFTLYDAMSVHEERVNWPPYLEDYVGEYCGNCAADRTERKFGH